MPVRSYLQVLFWKRRNLSYAALSFHRPESRLKVSRAHAANYRNGPMYNSSVGVVCPTHILDEKGGSSNPLEPLLRTPLKTHLRNRMGEDRLAALTLLNINSNLDIDPKEIVAVLSKRISGHRND